MTAPWTSEDHYIPRPDVPGHHMTRTSLFPSRNFTLACECGWQHPEPLAPGNVTAAANRHRIEATP